jgi:hypothetical protein
MNTAIAIVLWFVIPLLLILLATKIGDKPELAIEATNTAAPVCPKLLPNPCVRIDCDKPVKGYIA